MDNNNYFLRERRMMVPKFLINETNLFYLNAVAKKKDISRSRLFEKIALEVIFFYLPKDKTFWIEEKPRKRAKWGKKQRKYKKAPSFSLSPSTLNILQRTKENREVTFTLMVDEIFYLYRKKYPKIL